MTAQCCIVAIAHYITVTHLRRVQKECRLWLSFSIADIYKYGHPKEQVPDGSPTKQQLTCQVAIHISFTRAPPLSGICQCCLKRIHSGSVCTVHIQQTRLTGPTSFSRERLQSTRPTDCINLINFLPAVVFLTLSTFLNEMLMI